MNDKRMPLERFLHTLYAFDEGERPRAGTRVYLGHERSPGTILTVSKGGIVFCHEEGAIKVRQQWIDDVAVDRRRRRATLQELLSTCADLASVDSKVNFPCLNTLVMHFHGANGCQYRNPLAFTWLLVALAQQYVMDVKRPVEVRDFLTQHLPEFTGDGIDPDQLPWELRQVRGEVDTLLPTWDASDKRYSSVWDKVKRGMELAGDFLAKIPDSLQTPAATEELVSGLMVHDHSTGREVAILGTSIDSSDVRWLDVIDLAHFISYPTHADELEPLGIHRHHNDPELLTAVLRSISRYDWAAIWYMLHHPLYQGADHAFLRVLLAAAYYRLSVEENRSQAKKAMRLVVDAQQLLPKAEKTKVIALFPELVNTKAKKNLQSLGKARPLLHIWLKETVAILAPVLALNEQDEDLSTQDDLSTQPGTEKSPLSNASPSSSESSVQAVVPRPLRFKVTEHPLLAMEWALPGTTDSFSQAMDSTLEWLGQRLGTTLPARWSQGGHEIDLAGVRLEVEAARSLFAFRLEHPDNDHPTRTWRLEATILQGQTGAGGMVGLRVLAQDRSALTTPRTGVPRLVRALAEAPGLLLGEGSPSLPLQVASHKDSFSLRRCVEDTQRDFPVWVASTADAESLLGKSRGLSTLAVLTANQRTDYEKRNGALEAGYAHCFAPGRTAPSLVELANEAAVQGMMADAIAARQRPGTPSFRQVRDLIREAAMHRPERPSDPHADRKVGGGERPSSGPEMPEGSTDLEQLLDLAIGDREALAHELGDARTEITALRSKLHALQQGLAAATSEPDPERATAEFPASLSELPEWAPSISPRVVFADKALRLAARTPHAEVGKIYACLQALHDHYWAMRWGEDAEARQRWLQFLEANGLSCGQIGHALENHHYADAYKVQMDRKSYTMTLHIQGSSSRDPMRCIRIYFHPDEENRRILVGSLPIHLDNTYS